MNEMPLCVSKDVGDKVSVINGYDASILPLCAKLAAQVNAFLEAEAETPLLKAVQEQTRVALGVISTALDRYRYYLLLIEPATGPQSRADNLLTGVQFRSNLPLLQRRKRLPSSPYTPSLLSRYLQEGSSAKRAALRIHHLSAPVQRSRCFRR
jgi:hypothetical protein